MKFSLLRALFVLVAVCMPGGAAEPSDADPTALARIQANIEDQKVDSEIAFFEMSVFKPGAEEKTYQAVLAYRLAEDGSRDYMFRLVAPEDVEGVTAISHEMPDGSVEHWFYLPTVGKPRQLSPSAANGAFLGSDFSFADLLREIPSNHDYSMEEETMRDSQLCYVVRAREKGETSQSPYLYRDILLNKQTSRLVGVDFYDQEGKRVKQLTTEGYYSKSVRGTSKRPRYLKMTDTRKGTKTYFKLLESHLDVDFPEDPFDPDVVAKWTPDDVDAFVFKYGLVIRPDAPN